MVLAQNDEHDLSELKFDMTKLASLHNRLTTLRQTRQSVRLATALAALAIAVLWALAGVFILDWAFELPVLPRLIVMVLGALGCFWAFTKYTRPMLGVEETELDMALMVERQQEIDSDLVAALQFESPQAATWGSRQLETAVIDYVAELGSGLNVFEGFSREQMTRRGTILGISALVAVAFVLVAPTYAGVFFDRLMLGGRHYPSSTVIDRVLVNDQAVLEFNEHGATPETVKGAQGHPMLFYVQCSGELPNDGKLRVRAASGGASREVDLKPLTNDQRVSRLRTAVERIDDAIAHAETDIGGTWQQEVAALLSFDAAKASAQINKLKDNRAGLPDIKANVEKVIAAWPGEASKTRVYLGDMGRLVDEVRYGIKVGDGWTDPALVKMIPLPMIEPQPEVIPPKYAQATKEKPSASQRQLSVLEGSEVKMAIKCLNDKPLKEAYLIAKSVGEAKKYPLTKTDAKGLAWSLEGDTPFKQVAAEIRYEIQVTDNDDLHLESPIRGIIRIRADRPPTGVAESVLRIVVPAAKPIISYRLNDDYGISELKLRVQIQRTSESAGTADGDSEQVVGDSEQDKVVTFTLHSKDKPYLPTIDTVRATYELNLAPLMLVKGDRLKVTLDVTDYRGDAPGLNYLSDPLVFEVSDDAGVLGQMSEGDERLLDGLSDVLKKQLGIGESP